MWQTLNSTNWPSTDGRYWIRKGGLTAPYQMAVVLIERNKMYFHGSSLLTQSRYDHDIHHWQIFTQAIAEPTEVAQPLLWRI